MHKPPETEMEKALRLAAEANRKAADIAADDEGASAAAEAAGGTAANDDDREGARPGEG